MDEPLKTIICRICKNEVDDTGIVDDLCMTCQRHKLMGHGIDKDITVKIKDTPEQRELFIGVIEGKENYKEAIEKFSKSAYLQIIKTKNLDIWQCDWLPVDELNFTAKIEFPFTIKKDICKK